MKSGEVVIFDSVYDQILKDMGETPDDIHCEIKRFFLDAMWSSPWDIYSDPDFKQESWINSMDWGDRKSQLEVYQSLPAHEKGFMLSLTKAESDWYMFFSGASSLWNFNVNCTGVVSELRDLVGSAQKHSIDWDIKGTPQEWKPDFVDRCPLLVDFVERLPFETRGLVQIMGILPGQGVPKHRDVTHFGKQLADNLMISFMPDTMPKYVTVESVKYKVKALWFDEGDYHETDPVPYFSYAIKVDGTFDRETLCNKYIINC